MREERGYLMCSQCQSTSKYFDVQLFIIIMIVYFLCSYHPTISDLVDHLKSQHNTQVQIQILHFVDVEVFKSWKKKDERRTYSNYMQ